MSLVKEELAAMLVSSPPPLSPALGQEPPLGMCGPSRVCPGGGGLSETIRGFPRDGIPSWG